MVGLTLLLLLAVEAGTSLAFVLRDALQSRSHAQGTWPSEAFAGSEWMASYPDEHERRIYQWRPYVHWRTAPLQGELINVGPDGVRRTWNGGACSEVRSTKVFMFGGSALWGTGARDDFTIPSWVARELARLGYRGVCVINWGESGYVSTQEVIALLLLLRDGRVPAAVVFYDGINDIAAAYQRGVAGDPQNEINRIAEFNLTKRGGEMLVRGLTQIFRASNIYRLASGVRARVTPTEVERRSIQPNLAGDVVATYAANVDLVRRLGREYGFQTLFYWQPVAFVSKSLTSDEEQVVEQHRYLESLIRSAYARVTWEKRLRSRGDFRDLSGVFRGVPATIFIDFVHTSEAGNERIAAEMVKDLRRVLDAQGYQRR